MGGVTPHTAGRPSRRIAFWLAILTVPLCAGVGFSQVFREPASNTPNVFGFTLFSFSTPAGKADLPAWLEAVEGHQPGTKDTPLLRIENWPQGRLQQVVGTYLEGKFAKPTPETLARAAVLHTDVAAMALEGGTPDLVRKSLTPATHFGAAMELVEHLRRYDKESPFPRLWYRVVAACLVAHYDIGVAPAFMEQATAVFRKDPDLLLLAGSVYELLASPRIQEAVDLPARAKGTSLNALLHTAERFYQEAVTVAPALTEARGRLGRVLGRQGAHARALAELRRALGETPSPDLEYFFTLFAGQEEEALGHRDAARNAFRRALELRPEAQFGYLALSRLERGGGSRPAAADAVQTMLRVRRGPEGDADPWADYYAAGQARQASRLLDELRQTLRRVP